MTEFIETKQYRLFEEFCDACARYKYIGVCHGVPGVGKTLSARHYANWDAVMRNPLTGLWEEAVAENGVECDTIFYTVPVVITASQLERKINALRSRIRIMSPAMMALNEDINSSTLVQIKV